MCSISQTERNKAIVKEVLKLNETMDIRYARKIIAKKYTLTPTMICKLTSKINWVRRCECGNLTKWSVRGKALPCPKCAGAKAMGLLQSKPVIEKMEEENEYFSASDMKGIMMHYNKGVTESYKPVMSISRVLAKSAYNNF